MQKEISLATALVTAVHRDRYAVECPQGAVFARLKSAAYRDADTRDFPTVGDRVDLQYNPQGDSWILATHPRSAYFLRKLPFLPVGEQAVAANFDEVFILASLNQDFNPRRIERYAALAWQSGGKPIIVLTKRDLVDDPAPYVAETASVAPGVDIYVVSALHGDGMDALRERLVPGRTVVLLGSSGVGKSSLVNGLAGSLLMDTGGIREDDARGRHTTTHRQMLTLPGGVRVIDTPGMREIGLWDAEQGVREAFDDIDEIAQNCRFSNCAHLSEPGCAVKRAIDEGLLDAGRLKSYHKLQREAARRQKKR